MPDTVDFGWERPVDSESPGEPVVRLRAGATPPSPGSLIDRAFGFLDLARTATTPTGNTPAASPMRVLLALPSHREVAAAYVVIQALHIGRMLAHDVRDALVLLPQAHGATGAATSLALGYGMASGDGASRTAAADALLGFAERGGLSGSAAGSHLALLAEREQIKLGRMVSALDEVAGAAPTGRGLVADLLSGALPRLIELDRRGLAEALALACECAASGARMVPVAGLDGLAGRAGSSKTVTEARRLRTLLG